MKQYDTVMAQCRRIRAKARTILTCSEHLGIRIRRPAARRAARFALDVQNRLIIRDSAPVQNG